MNITINFAKAIKFSLIIAISMIIYSLLLSYFRMYGISISYPNRNSVLRIILNQTKVVLQSASFWILVGYLSKDYKSAILAFFVAITLYFGIHILYAKNYAGMPINNIKYLLLFLGAIIPYIIFGLAHFKNSKGLMLIFLGVIIWGLPISFDTSGFERMIEGFTAVFNWREPFEIHIPTGESGYEIISVLRLLNNELFLIIDITVFWWIYQLIKSNNKSIWRGMNTINSSVAYDRLSYSIIYWSFRIMLFIVGMGIVSYIEYRFQFPINIISIIRLTAAIIAIIIITSIYRNFLIMYFIQQNKYPNRLYVALNVPVINLFAWVFSLFNFNNQTTKYNPTEAHNIFKNLKTKFIEERRNEDWKILIIILNAFIIIYKLNKAIFQVNGSGMYDGILGIILQSVITLTLLLWFLYNKNSFIPLLIIASIEIIIASILRDRSLLLPTMATIIINIVLFYGFFYFDQLKLADNLSIKTKKE